MHEDERRRDAGIPRHLKMEQAVMLGSMREHSEVTAPKWMMGGLPTWLIVGVLCGASSYAAEIEYFPAANADHSEAVRVQRGDLAHTGMLLSGRRGDVVAEMEGLLTEIQSVTKRLGADLQDVVKLNLYVDRDYPKQLPVAISVLLAEWPQDARPALTVLPTPIIGGRSRLAVDAVIAIDPQARSKFRLEKNVSVAPAGRDLVYVSGRAAAGELDEATTSTMKELLSVVSQLDMDPRDVIQVKAFINSMSDWEDVRDRIVDSFGDQSPPPIVYVKWMSPTRATEIELIASAPAADTDQPLSFFTPDGDKSSPVFSRVARVHSDEVIYISGIYGTHTSSPELEVRTALSELIRTAYRAGSDLQHLAKATYYVSQGGSSAALNQLRPDYYQADRPPAASKVAVASLGARPHGLMMDMVAVPAMPSFLHFVKARAEGLKAEHQIPESLRQWKQQREELKSRLEDSWGGFPEKDVDLNPRTLGTLKREGYSVEKVVFQTLPGVSMTANVYVPDQSKLPTPARLPAVLCVHGHWRGAKQDPHVQARCIGLAKLGFVVLAVDAFGAGERGLGKALGEYHGEMVAATLLPSGLPLSGLQVYENRRAVDYLVSRPDVDADRLGITGASGGGNQTMYAGAYDERFQAVVPVCSVGNYQAYLGVACCMCEVVPDALQYTEEWGVLSLTAPRGLMVISATRDGIQFSVKEAKKSLALAKPVFELYERPDNLKHAVFESPHDYNQPMREAMYGWMTKHLKQEGDGSPIPEPMFDTEDPEVLRCFPGDTRPDDWVTLPEFAAREAKRLSDSIAVPTNQKAWQELLKQKQEALAQTLHLNVPSVRSDRETPLSQDDQSVHVKAETGILLDVAKSPSGRIQEDVFLVLGIDSKAVSGMAKSLAVDGRSVLTVPLRATGQNAVARDSIGRAPDHNSAEWSLWIGRPLVGQWCHDVRVTLDALESDGGSAKQITVVGIGPAGLAALCSGAIDSRIDRVVTVGALASFISDAPYEKHRLGMFPNGILRDVGDIAHIASMVAPRRLMIVGGVDGVGAPLEQPDLERQFKFTSQVYSLETKSDRFDIHPTLNSDDIAQRLK